MPECAFIHTCGLNRLASASSAAASGSLQQQQQQNHPLQAVDSLMLVCSVNTSGMCYIRHGNSRAPGILLCNGPRLLVHALSRSICKGCCGDELPAQKAPAKAPPVGNL